MMAEGWRMGVREVERGKRDTESCLRRGGGHLLDCFRRGGEVIIINQTPSPAMDNSLQMINVCILFYYSLLHGTE